MQHSESLLTEILALLQTLNANVHDFQKQLKTLEEKLGALEKDVGEKIARAFPEDLLIVHHEEHRRLSRPNILRRFLRTVDKALS